MKNKGFTLAELLGVIVILGLICLVAFPPILNSIKKSKNNISEATKQVIYGASNAYINNHLSQFTMTENSAYCIRIQTLIDSKVLESDLKDPNTNRKIDPNLYVKVLVKNNEYNYSMAKQGEC